MITKIFQLINSAASRLGQNQKLIILIYHRVLDDHDFMHPQQVDVKKFTWQMSLLAEHFNVLSLSDALSQLQSGCLPPRAVCITFDDGYADGYRNALPVLRHYGLPATFFVVSGMLDQDRMWSDDIVETVRIYPESRLDLSALGFGQYVIATTEQRNHVAHQLVTKVKYLPLAERTAFCCAIASLIQDLPEHLMLTTTQLRSLSEQGMEIGAHSVNHPILKSLSIDAWQQEIQQSKVDLEVLLNKPVRYFAYPNGKLGDDYILEHRDFVVQCGYEAALATTWGCVTNTSDAFQLPRFTPWDDSPKPFLLRMAHMYWHS